MFDLVRNAEDWFSRVAAHVMSVSSKCDWSSLEVKTIIENFTNRNVISTSMYKDI